jgi:hypothetical protein
VDGAKVDVTGQLVSQCQNRERGTQILSIKESFLHEWALTGRAAEKIAGTPPPRVFLAVFKGEALRGKDEVAVCQLWLLLHCYNIDTVFHQQLECLRCL